MKLVKFNVKFNGFYEWGSGWDSITADKWNKFWSENDSIFWHTTIDKCGWSDNTYIVSVGGGGMIHPMGFNIVCNVIGKTSKYVDGVEIETFPSLEELTRLCEEVAELCGGTCKIDPFQVFEV